MSSDDYYGNMAKDADLKQAQKAKEKQQPLLNYQSNTVSKVNKRKSEN